nr:MAG TPA: hypothetical protein [Caudoviricetes sp.]
MKFQFWSDCRRFLCPSSAQRGSLRRLEQSVAQSLVPCSPPYACRSCLCYGHVV